MSIKSARRNLTNKSGAFFLSGVEDIDWTLNLLPHKIAKKVLFQAVGAGATQLAREMRKQVPSQMKSVRKAIGHKFIKRQKLKANQARAKIGGAVGKKRSKQQSEARELKQQRKATKQQGVGISSANVHWWLLGTVSRQQKKSGRQTGRMPAASPNPIQMGFRASDSTVMAKIRERIRKGVIRELGKLARGKQQSSKRGKA